MAKVKYYDTFLDYLRVARGKIETIEPEKAPEKPKNTSKKAKKQTTTKENAVQTD